MNTGILVIGLLLVVLGVLFAFGAIRTYLRRESVEDAAAWSWGGIGLGLMLVAIGGVLINSYLGDRREGREARERIPIGEATIRSFTVTGEASSGFDAEIEVANRSILYHLISVTVEITAYDCEGPEITAGCSELRKREIWLPVNLPPQDKRTLRRSLGTIGALDGNLLWGTRVIQTVGAE